MTDENTHVRSCSFNPSENLIPVRYDNYGNEKTELYLEVKYRELWFQIYCEEKGVNGVIEVDDLRFAPSDTGKLLVSTTARVKIDGVMISQIPVARFVSAGDSDAIQRTVTLAVGRALKEAGFGTLSCLESEDGGDYPCDSGYMLVQDRENPGRFVRREIKNPLIPETKTAEQKKEKCGAAPSQETPVKKAESGTESAVNAPATMKEAYTFRVPFGEFKGKTISHVMGVEPKRIGFFASDKFNSDTKEKEAFKAACRMVIDASRASA